VQQVLLNLLDNALKFTSQGSVALRVAAKDVSSSEVLLYCSVTDTGMGIPQEKCKTIFEAFSQADGSTTRQFGGTGLGLTISSQLAKMMGGEIWLESEVGVGSTFHFTARLGLDTGSAAGRESSDGRLAPITP
jgi:signal transduction histidine kinase